MVTCVVVAACEWGKPIKAVIVRSAGNENEILSSNSEPFEDYGNSSHPVLH